MVTLSVVIPATDGRATLDRVVQAIEAASAAPEEVIVVDRPEHLGPAAARNLGSERASGDVLVFVDSDLVVHDDAFVRIRAAFDEDPELSAVFGSYDDDPEDGGIVSDFRNLLHHHVHHEGAGPATTFWTGLGAIRREAFLQVDRFNERQPWVEDVELGMRVHQSGGRILLDPSIQGKHLKRWTLVSMVKTDLFHRGVPWLRMLLEGRSSSSTLNLAWRHRVGTAASVVLVVALARRNFRVAAGALAFQLALDGEFYGLLYRRRGAAMLAAGPPLHILHRLTGAAAVPVALAGYLASRRNRRPTGPLGLSGRESARRH